MKILALDIGTRRTGVAYLDEETGVPLPLDTILHVSHDELLHALLDMIRMRKIDRVIVGLPFLPSGDEGAQARESRVIGSFLASRGISISYVDERYSTPRNSDHKHALPTARMDGDAAAACTLLNSVIRS